MRASVGACECLIILLSGRKEREGDPDSAGDYEGVFTSRLCHEQMAAARKVGVRIVGVMETDERHGKPDFALEKSRARAGNGGGPVHDEAEANLRLLDEVCFVPLRRQEHEVPGMLGEILRQAEVEPHEDFEPEPEPVWEGVPPA